MSWSKVKDLVGKSAPLIGGLLGGPGGAAAGKLLSSVLGVEEKPDEIERALVGNPDALIKVRDLELSHQRELQAMTLNAQNVELQEQTKRLAEINATMRAEVASEDPYVRRWRPTFGYAIAGTWTLTFLGVIGAGVYVVVMRPADAGEVINALAALLGAMGLMWATALAVLGIQVDARSKDKQAAAGIPPTPGLLGAWAQRIASRGPAKAG